jgi:hypothetical protein
LDTAAARASITSEKLLKIVHEPRPYRLAAATVVEYAESGFTPEEIVGVFPGTPLDKVKNVLAYYCAHQPELTPSR